MLGIRADANDIIATGHIMRCITIAKAVKKRRENCLFFIADDYAKGLLESAGMEYVCLHTDWEQKEEELPKLLEALQKMQCTRVLVDSYQSTPAYLERLQKEYPTAYIDDLFQSQYDISMILNYNAYYTNFPYEETYGKDTILLLGTSYVPLREEFCAPKQNWDCEKHILLSCGGGDIHQVIYDLLEEVCNTELIENLYFHVVAGRYQTKLEELKNLSKQYRHIHIHENVTQMAQLMDQCEIAVSAAGTMLYELCARQIPTIFFEAADNQKYDRIFFAKDDCMVYAGSVLQEKKACIDQIIKALFSLQQDPIRMQKMKQQMQKITDGKGADRIAEALLRIPCKEGASL